MKAIAEYFRDLASDDRYFGAEPPTPDAEMLARIAERETSRRIDARQERGAIVLRPSAAAAQEEPEAPLSPALAAVPAQVPDAPDMPADAPSAPPAAEPVETVAEAAAPEVHDEVSPEPAAAPLEPAVESPAEPIVAAADTAEASVAAKLQRIRAVVSRNDALTEPDDASYSEDEHAEDYLAEATESIQAALDTDDQAEIAAVSEDTEEDDGGFSALLDAVTARAGAAPAEVEAPAALPEEVAEKKAEQAQAPAAPLRARVLKMKRADFEAAVADGRLEEEDEYDDDFASTLSPEEEAELQRELAEVEAELSPEDEEGEVASIFADDDEGDDQAPAQRDQLEDSEPDMSRLMAKTKTEMDSPEGANRRNAIAHLRAAVAATRAETEAGEGLNRGEDSVDAYRDDLNSVVRPRRLTAEHRRQDEPRPAPLKLVAEQRIDTNAPKAVSPVRPRRVSLAEATPSADIAAVSKLQSDQPTETGSFAEFAERMGAEGLPDLLEAAAAYLSYVEGHAQFSRPQLMTKARQVEDMTFSREDGLRSFGQLLRQGKIEKLKGGRFTVSEQIGFKPDKRAAG
ncbi:hypothetical protein [Thalassovita taeanensis]|nr:hypothetical protein [Thalassovita taeanensis]